MKITQEQFNATYEAMLNQDLLQSYLDSLSKHDWNYQFSDCSFTYRQGCRTLAAIQQSKMQCIKAGLEKEAEEIYKEFMQRKAKAKRY